MTSSSPGWNLMLPLRSGPLRSRHHSLTCSLRPFSPSLGPSGVGGREFPAPPPAQSSSHHSRGSGSFGYREIIILECARTSGKCQGTEQGENNKPTPSNKHHTSPQGPDKRRKECGRKEKGYKALSLGRGRKRDRNRQRVSFPN